LCKAISTKPINFYINYAEVTYDFITHKPEELMAIINASLVHFQRNKSGYYYYHYSDKNLPENKRTHYTGSRNKHNFYTVTYSDNPSKIAHLPCAHVEFRIHTKPICEKHQLCVPSDLLSFDFEKYFKQHAVFYIPPNKAEIGRALAEADNIMDKSDRYYEIIYNKQVMEKTNNLEITYNDSVQELLSKIPTLKKILATEQNKGINAIFTANMQMALFKNYKPNTIPR
jgi:hypothetical protein